MQKTEIISHNVKIHFLSEDCSFFVRYGNIYKQLVSYSQLNQVHPDTALPHAHTSHLQYQRRASKIEQYRLN